MRHIRNSKRGFTLVELMLAMAIITIIGWTTVALMIAIKDSFMTTYNVNDSADYAILYANGFENAFLAATQNNNNVTVHVRESDNTLCKDSITGEIFHPSQMKTTRRSDGTVVDKWLVRMYFKLDTDPSGNPQASQCIRYRIYVLDNYYSPNLKLMNMYEGTIWPPHIGFGRITLSNVGDPNEDGHKFIQNNYGIFTDGWKDAITYVKK